MVRILISCILVLNLAPAFSSAEIVFDVDFNSMTVDLPPDATGPPNAPSLVDIQENTECLVVESFAGLNDQPVLLSDHDTSTSTALFFFPPSPIESGHVCVSWRASAHQLQFGGEMTFNSDLSHLWGHMGWHDTGQFWVQWGDGSGGETWAFVGNYSVDQPQDFLLMMDLDSSTFSISLNGNELLSERPFIDPGGAFVGMRFGTHSLEPRAGPGPNSYAFDDFRLYTQDWGCPVPIVSLLRLFPNVPNPFNPRTVLNYELVEPLPVNLQIYNLAGRLVRTLKHGNEEHAGLHSVPWNGCNDWGQVMPSGIYFYRLEAGEFCETRRMVLVR